MAKWHPQSGGQTEQQDKRREKRIDNEAAFHGSRLPSDQLEVSWRTTTSDEATKSSLRENSVQRSFDVAPARECIVREVFAHKPRSVKEVRSWMTNGVVARMR
jgi:hypothetical protein